MNREPLRVLVVEHDSIDAELELAELEQAGYEVRGVTVGTADELRALFGDWTFDVVLADYRLPGWTGVEALELIRTHAIRTPLILVTGTMGEERAVDALRQGVADYILKSNLARLPVAVRRACADARVAEDRRRNEAQIRKLTHAVDQSPAVVFITDTKGRIEYVNARFSEVTGYSAAEALGATPRLLSSGLTPPEKYVAMWSALAAGRTWQGELRNRRKSGRLYWDEVTISPLRDEDGAVTHYIASQEDVTGRRLMIEELRESDRRFRELAENISEVFFVVDADFSAVQYVNKAYERVWGRSCASLRENPLSFVDALAPEDRARLIDHIAALQAGTSPTPIEFGVIQPDGSQRWVLSNAAAVRDEKGRVYRISGFALDITDRQRTKEALRASERRLRTLFETVNLLVLVLDRDGRVEYLNPFALRLTGCELPDVIGADWISRFTPTPEHTELREVFDELIGTAAHPHRRSGLITADGGVRRIAWHNTVLRDDQGRPTGSLSVGEDVTDTDKLEDQLRQAQKMEAVGRLAGGVAHDFNNLLTVIISYGEMLRERFPEGAEVRDDIDPILTAADAASGLTRQLLAFSRQQVIQPRPVRLEEVIAQSGKLLRRVIGEDVELVTRFNDPPSTVLIDPGQLDQVVMNLAVNARDAMPEGGQLTIETDVADLSEDYAHSHWPSTAGRFARVTVTDTGTGMDEATKRRIFEPFFTTKESGKGTGLGLATVYGIVKQSGGFIWVYSEPGLGTTFRIYFPLVEQASAGPFVRPLGSNELPRGTETILLVEDAAAVRAAAAKVLSSCGYTVIEATGAREALDLAGRRAGAIDLLITDVVMPGMGGRELAALFAPLRPNARILFMSGYTGDAIAHHSLLEPGVHYLQKPFSRDVIARKVREVLDG